MWFSKKTTVIALFFVTICMVQRVLSQDLINIEVKNLLKMQHGLGWPYVLRVAEGNEALLRLDKKLEDLKSCDITTPFGLTFDVQSPPSNRYAKWSDGCGVRIRSIAMTDEGRWRMTATAGNNSFTGWSEVYVEESKSTYSAAPIALRDGETETEVELTSLENSYCLVSKPFSESSLVPGHCSVTLDRATRAIQGSWNILLGLPGQVSELEVQRQVTVETERLDVGYVYDRSENKLHLYCNILHTSKNITFCRFQKTSESFGYNIGDGLSDGRHSYYGDGFALKQCGLTLENPTANDYGTWRCSVGVQMWEGNVIRPQTPMQALISVPQDAVGLRIAGQIRNSDDEDVRTIFVQSYMPFTITCKANVSLSYCWFQHPNGTQYTPAQRLDEEQLFWYTGESLQTGDCGITFSHTTSEDAGKWICHMGPRDQLGIEITDHVVLRVTGSLAANKKEVGTNIGRTATLYCHTANGNRPLDYCRFLSPNFVGIRIDESVTENSAILNRYYFTPNRSLDYGDCSLTISPVNEEDIGVWTCAALIDQETLEGRDVITLYIDASTAPLFTAGIVGISLGAVVLVVALVGVLLYKRYWPKLPWRRTSSPSSSVDNFSMESMSQTSYDQ
ncbi:unnamed protein product [Parnassius apollo]|uniref:(apollo) hypothetical protein n=1 Tax=Parnassius apollo TaxID=110799 RepID=A0A8S3Y5M8_PARAO|nr:unnamed protein product [Parnassius apollo]